MNHDIVIRNGTLVDGSGAAPVSADLAISDGRITEIGDVSGKGKLEIDARDRLVTPGFVDNPYPPRCADGMGSGHDAGELARCHHGPHRQTAA